MFEQRRISRVGGRRRLPRQVRRQAARVVAGVAAAFAVPATASAACPAGQLLGNPGFETGTAAPWTASPGVIYRADNYSRPLQGIYLAKFNGKGTWNTSTLAQTLTIPLGCTTYRFGYFLKTTSIETTLFTAHDTLTVQVLDSAGAVLGTLHRWSNLNETLTYVGKSADMSAFAGKTVTIRFTGSEDGSLWTKFLVDQTYFNVS
jgi:hypothetical protein